MRLQRNLQDSLASRMRRDAPRRRCTRCGGVRFERVPRIGVMAATIMPFFNLYPWRCVLCNRIVYRALRINGEDPGNRA